MEDLKEQTKYTSEMKPRTWKQRENKENRDNYTERDDEKSE